jgi:hypothetical protein
MRADKDPKAAWLEPLRGIGYVVLLTGSVIAVGALIAMLALFVVEVLG